MLAFAEVFLMLLLAMLLPVILYYGIGRRIDYLVRKSEFKNQKPFDWERELFEDALRRTPARFPSCEK